VTLAGHKTKHIFVIFPVFSGHEINIPPDAQNMLFTHWDLHLSQQQNSGAQPTSVYKPLCQASL